MMTQTETATAPPANDLAGRVIGYMTPDEFFAFESIGNYENVRHELWDGKVVTTAGGKPSHNVIGANTSRGLGNAVETAGLNFIVYSADQMVRASDRRRYYPDVVIAEDPPRYDDKYALLNPLVIVEVLSPSTDDFDKNEKFAQYRTIDSLRHYILVEQDRVGVTHYEKVAGNLWAMVGTYNQISDALILNVGGASLSVPLQKIYARIVFPAAEEDQIG